MVCVLFMTIAKRIRTQKSPRSQDYFWNLIERFLKNLPFTRTRFRGVARTDGVLNSTDLNFYVFFPALKSPIKRLNFFHCFFAISWLVAVLRRILWRSEKPNIYACMSLRVSLPHASHRQHVNAKQSAWSVSCYSRKHSCVFWINWRCRSGVL